MREKGDSFSVPRWNSLHAGLVEGCFFRCLILVPKEGARALLLKTFLYPYNTSIYIHATTQI
jgi:hypothetical protein